MVLGSSEIGIVKIEDTMFPDLKVRSYDYIDPSRLSSLTCEQLGIPRDEKQSTIRQIRNTSLHIDGIRYEAITNAKKDPFSPYCMIPLPQSIGPDVLEPTCVRRRNERERDRVRCVNDGYLKLKEHLPVENKEKRMSKVETLRSAIHYIKHLEQLLTQDGVDISRTKITSDNPDVANFDFKCDRIHFADDNGSSSDFSECDSKNMSYSEDESTDDFGASYTNRKLHHQNIQFNVTNDCHQVSYKREDHNRNHLN